MSALNACLKLQPFRSMQATAPLLLYGFATARPQDRGGAGHDGVPPWLPRKQCANICCPYLLPACVANAMRLAALRPELLLAAQSRSPLQLARRFLPNSSAACIGGLFGRLEVATAMESLYKGVTYWPGERRRVATWGARDNEEFLGLYSSEQEAAQAVAERKGCAVAALLRPAVAIKIFAKWHRAWLLEDALPCDLGAAVARASLHQRMFTAMPGLELWSLQGKTAPWKDALYNSWLRFGCPSMEDVGTSGCPGPVLASVLQAAAQSMHNCPHRDARALSNICKCIGLQTWQLCSCAGQVVHAPNGAIQHAAPIQVWMDNCGQGVSHHSGFVAMLHALKIICKAGAHPSKPA